jgi:phosphoribosylformylglycinamidine synthase
MLKPNIAVILFPGINCEEETLLAVRSVGMDGSIVRWNSSEEIEHYDGYIIPGGWSYEDRVRAGVISAKDPLLSKIKEEAERGKPVLGICNGCQVLVEAGLIPGLKGKVEMALAPNINPFVSGFYCTWVYVKSEGACIFNSSYKKGEVIAMPIAHGEGRFTTKDSSLIKKLVKNGQMIFRYCDRKGNIEESFPINPNGSLCNIAAISNKDGNVMAMMPHPERANWLRQVPFSRVKNNGAGPGRGVFESMKRYIQDERG